MRRLPAIDDVPGHRLMARSVMPGVDIRRVITKETR